jgi:HK97 family phage portal protein
MGLLDTLERRAPAHPRGERRSGQTQLLSEEPQSWFLKAVNARPSNTGVQVDSFTALNMVTVHACVELIGGTLGSAPLVTYQRSGTARSRAYDHPSYNRLHDRPNPEVSAAVLYEMLQAHALLWGRAYAEIEFDQAGRFLALWPLLPGRTYARRRGGVKEYVTTLPNGQQVALPADKVLHIRGLSLRMLDADDPIHRAREAIGLGLAAEESAARFFANGQQSTGVLTHPQELEPETRDALREQWQEMHSGLENAHRVAILEEGMDWKKIGVDPGAAQLLESRQFSVKEIARFFRVPPHMVGDSEGSTSWGTGIEQQTIGFLTYTMLRWFTRWQQEINHQLFSERERGRFFTEFLLAGLARGDQKSRAEFLEIQRRNGVINADEWREFENMNPQAGGQGRTYWMPVNMMPADQVLDPGGEDAPPTPAPAGPPASRALPHGREQRSLSARRRLRQNHERLFRDAGERIVKREASGVRAVVRKWAAARTKGDLVAALERFYREHGEYVRRTILPPVTALAAAVQDVITDEMDAGADISAQIERFAAEYAAAFRTRHTGSALGQLRQIIDAAEAEAMEAELEERLGEWEEGTPEKIGRREVVRTVNAVARVAYVLVGVQTLRWVTSGEACAICTSLDGREVSASRSFVAAGDTVEGGEDQEPITVEHDVSHPPLHDGCTCDLVPA